VDVYAEAEKVVGWARNHHLGLCLFDPPTSNGKLMIPRDRYVHNINNSFHHLQGIGMLVNILPNLHVSII
jgi:hypothetical protein